MIGHIFKLIISVFLSAVAILLVLLWVVFGTMLLIALLIRLIALYTIALLNNFISGTPLIVNYTKAIEEVIEMYITTYGKLFSMPLLPWRQEVKNESENNSQLRALLPTEMAELRKSWAITIIVFVSYILSFGVGTAYVMQNRNSKIEDMYKTEISEAKKELAKEKRLNLKINEELQIEKNHEIEIIRNLYLTRNFSIGSIAQVLETNTEVITSILEENNIRR